MIGIHVRKYVIWQNHCYLCKICTVSENTMKIVGNVKKTHENIFFKGRQTISFKGKKMENFQHWVLTWEHGLHSFIHSSMELHLHESTPSRRYPSPTYLPSPHSQSYRRRRFNPITGGGPNRPPRLVFLLSTENGLRWGLEISWPFIHIHWKCCTKFLSFYFAQRRLQDHFLGGMFAKLRPIFSSNFRKL